MKQATTQKKQELIRKRDELLEINEMEAKLCFYITDSFNILHFNKKKLNELLFKTYLCIYVIKYVTTKSGVIFNLNKEYRKPSDGSLLVDDKRLHSRRQDKWYLNKLQRELFVPTSVSEQIVTKFINKLTPGNNNYEQEQDDNDDVEIEKILGDYMFCNEDAELSRNFINIFMEDGSVVQRNYCVSCVNDSFAFNL